MKPFLTYTGRFAVFVNGKGLGEPVKRIDIYQNWAHLELEGDTVLIPVGPNLAQVSFREYTHLDAAAASDLAIPTA